MFAPVFSAYAEDAISVAAAYRGDLWRNVQGGVRKGGRYFDDFVARADVDMDKAVGLAGGTFSVTVLNNNGAHFSDTFVGAAQVISNTETTSAFRLYEAWYDQHLLDDRLSVRVGLYDLNSEFDAIEPAGLFVNSSHGIGPDFSQSGQAGPSIFPVTSLAARVHWHVTDSLLLRLAVLDGVPGDPAHPKRTAIKLGKGDGALIAGEAEMQFLGSTIALGAWGYTAAFDDLAAVDPLTGLPIKRGDNRGAYVEADRRIMEGDEEGEGLSVFARFGVAEGRINTFGSYVGAGAVYDGIVRDTSVGFAVASAATGKTYRQVVAAEKRETILEATMRTQITPWLALQPDVQYIINPSADPTLRNALAVGLRFEISGAASF
ncbi:MAG: carbohydrate porin [Rhodospirillaceae bacterium]|nr:carbohydrate porin [Rhodospirillaceae bacterium]